MIKRNGFTLIELLIVLVIIGVLVTLAIPQYQVMVERARAVEAIEIMSMLRKVQEVYYAERGHYQQVNPVDDPDDPQWMQLGIDNPNAQGGTYFIYDFLTIPAHQQIFGLDDYGWVARPRDEFEISPYPPTCRYITMRQDTGEIAGTYLH